MNTRTFIPGYHTGHPALWRVYMGDDLPNQEGPGGVPLQGDTTDHRESKHVDELTGSGITPIYNIPCR